MNVTSSPLIQELTPDRFVGWMLNFVDAGYKGLLVKKRINNITFPETRGILRQAEGMSARQEATFQAELQMGIAKARQSQMNVTVGEVATGAAETIVPPPPSTRSTSSVLTGSAAPTKIMLNAALADAATRIDTNEYCLVNQQTGHSFSRMPLSVEKQALMIDRELNNNLIVQDSQCSRHHAQITYNQGIYDLTDVGSANGTLVNGKRLSPQQSIGLEIGMTIQIGTQLWHFEEKPLPATAVDQRF